MKKLFRYKFIFAAALMGIFASCNDDEDVTKNTRLVKPVVTLDQTNFTVTEGESITITMTSDKPLNDEMNFKLELIGGDGTFREFTTSGSETDISVGAGIIGYIVTMPAYATTHTFTITPSVDLDAETTETFQIAFTSAVNAKGAVAPGSDMITLTVANAVSNDFVIRMEWQNYTADAFGTLHADTYTGADGDEHEFCPFDFDLELYDADFNLVDASYTGCPEEITIPADAPDGDYVVVPSFWTNAGSEPEGGQLVYPVMVTLSKPGIFKHTVDMTGQFTYVAGGAEEGNPNAYVPIAIVTKAGTMYTVTDYTTGEVLAQGRMATLMNMLRSKRSRS
ncbi:MAG TPA: hypothetical protein VFQ50_06735 [Flavobacterium sp.]|jgi:hypothetical protein|nr:hypothetical protein [Flavobacterium sp.]